jgi:hypothetical protein
MSYNSATVNEQSRIALRYASFNINYASSSKSKTILPKESTNSIYSSEKASLLNDKISTFINT